MCCGDSNTKNNGNFTYVAFSTDRDGTNFSINRYSGGLQRNWMAIYNSPTELDVNSPTFQNFFYNRWVYMEQQPIPSMILVNGNPFFWIKNPSNLTMQPKKGDSAVNGYKDHSTFVELMFYSDGDPADIESWVIIREIEEIETE